MAGEPKRARAWRTDRMNPDTRAGSTIGNVMVIATQSRPAPSTAAASSTSDAMRASVLATMM